MKLLWEGGEPLGLRFALLHRAFKKQMDEQTKDLGLTSVQLRVLNEINLLENSGIIDEINQKDLEEIEQVTHPTMTKVLKQLETKGFIECSPSEMDHRYKKIIATSKAGDISRAMDEKEEIILAALCDGLSESDMEELYRITDVIMDNIRKE